MVLLSKMANSFFLQKIFPPEFCFHSVDRCMCYSHCYPQLSPHHWITHYGALEIIDIFYRVQFILRHKAP